MGHARALVGHADASVLALRAVNDKLSVREIERLVRRGDSVGRGRKPAATHRDPTTNADIEAVQNHIDEILGLTVRLKTDADHRPDRKSAVWGGGGQYV